MHSKPEWCVFEAENSQFIQLLKTHQISPKHHAKTLKHALNSGIIVDRWQFVSGMHELEVYYHVD